MKEVVFGQSVDFMWEDEPVIDCFIEEVRLQVCLVILRLVVYCSYFDFCFGYKCEEVEGFFDGVAGIEDVVYQKDMVLVFYIWDVDRICYSYSLFQVMIMGDLDDV